MGDVSIQLWITCVMVVIVGLSAWAMIGYNMKMKREKDKDNK